jgi:hypothetical protein
MGGLDLRFGLGLYALIDWRRKFVGFVNRRRLRLLFGKAIALFEGLLFGAIRALDDTVEFGLEPVVGTKIESAAEQQVA